MTLIETANSLMNERLLDVFPDSIRFNGATIDCIAPPLDIFKTITTGPYDAKVTFTFQIRETDRAESGMNLKDSIEYDSPYAEQFGKTHFTFQISNFQPDANDSLVQIICNLKQ